jgi:3-oxoacyl-[acyl-carrier protein] reductase
MAEFIESLFSPLTNATRVAPMELGLKDKVIVVAGGSKGLGFAIAKACAADGARIAIASRDAANVETAVARLHKEYGIDATGHCVDMANAAGITAWVEAVVAHFGRIDGVVVNAGGPPPGTFDQLDDAKWQTAFELTLMSAVRLIRATLPHLRQQKKSAILTLTSSSIKEPIDFLLLSNVLRSGVNSLAKSLSRQLAPDGIRVNNLVPGLIATDRMISLDTTQAAAKNMAEQRAAGEKLIPVGRYGEPDEFGKAGAFLLSDAASYITGSTLVVDGGTMKSI